MDKFEKNERKILNHFKNIFQGNSNIYKYENSWINTLLTSLDARVVISEQTLKCVNINYKNGRLNILKNSIREFNNYDSLQCAKTFWRPLFIFADRYNTTKKLTVFFIIETILNFSENLKNSFWNSINIQVIKETKNNLLFLFEECYCPLYLPILCTIYNEYCLLFNEPFFEPNDTNLKEILAFLIKKKEEIQNHCERHIHSNIQNTFVCHICNTSFKGSIELFHAHMKTHEDIGTKQMDDIRGYYTADVTNWLNEEVLEEKTEVGSVRVAILPSEKIEATIIENAIRDSRFNSLGLKCFGFESTEDTICGSCGEIIEKRRDSNGDLYFVNAVRDTNGIVYHKACFM
eukprot:TRINITY_DN832_c0_g1_i1.p1 TRINITY_DN832_c0_g1~~TRINITY_DN832_c0_g1_i1.p1  ORF type:complete len:347 (+),score=93.90 TRINITY_DN832_c0_g1_i1:69-1109(+)